MKKIYLKTVFAAALLMTTSCGEDFLEVPRYEILEPELLASSEEYVNQGLNALYDTFLPDKHADAFDIDIAQSWNMKPHHALANFPSMDVGGGGWDKEYWSHSWVAGKDMFQVAWKICYRAISRCNTFLAEVEKADPSIFADGETGKNKILAQAHAIRGYYYLYLSQNFGRVPMLETGETYSSTPSKPRPETMDGTYQLILDDFDFAARYLDWTPENGEYGRFTKGAALAYAAWTYMYMEDFETAKGLYKQIIDSGTYELLPSFGELYQMDHYWEKESVWEVAFYHWADLGWGATNSTEDVWWGFYLTAPAEYGGWGGTFVSHEFCRSFEPGDKRRQYSVVAVGETNPYTGQTVGADPSYAGDWEASNHLPNNYCLKLWKHTVDNPVFTPISAIHMRYAAVLLNYAECCFETNDPATGWEYIGMIRDRAWGNLEVGQTPSEQYASSTLKYNTEIVEVPDAQTYYTQYKAEKGYTSDVWKVALTIERRHEFLLEYEFWYDLCRTDMAKDFLDAEYPKNDGSYYTEDGLPRTPRTFDYDPNRELYPIPTLEILTNPAIGPEDQNPGY